MLAGKSNVLLALAAAAALADGISELARTQ